MHIISNIGLILFAIWLIIWGVTHALSIGNQVITVLMGILAVVTAIFILIGK